MKQLFKRLWKEEEGQDLVEYGLLLLLITLAAIASLQSLSTTVSNIFAYTATSITTS